MLEKYLRNKFLLELNVKHDREGNVLIQHRIQHEGAAMELPVPNCITPLFIPFIWYDTNFSEFDSADIIDYILEKSVSCQKKDGRSHVRPSSLVSSMKEQPPIPEHDRIIHPTIQILCMRKLVEFCFCQTDCMNPGTHVVTSSFKPASLNSKIASCTQFYRESFCI